MLTFSELTYTQHWLVAFVFTQAVEVPIYMLALTRLGGPPRLAKTEAGPPLPLPLRLFVALAASLVTHPVVWFVWPRLVPDYLTMVLGAEAFAVLTEALLLHLCGLRWALPLSLLANGASLGIGLASRSLFGLP